jgi:hypothetical protein
MARGQQVAGGLGERDERHFKSRSLEPRASRVREDDRNQDAQVRSSMSVLLIRNNKPAVLRRALNDDMEELAVLSFMALNERFVSERERTDERETGNLLGFTFPSTRFDPEPNDLSLPSPYL